MGEELNLASGTAVLVPATEVFHRPNMPPEIAAAIVAVMAKITPLSKDATNSFQRYDYVSVDQFYALVGRLMAETGIFTVLYEKNMIVGERKTSDDRGNIKTSVWLSAVYDVWLYHKTGAAFGPVERSITVPASGAQSYASAISFVEKYYLRSLFKIPTGEGDADQEDKRSLPATNGRRDAPARYEGRTAGQGSGTPEEEAAQSKIFYINTAERDWSQIETQKKMTAWWTDHKDAINDVFDGNTDPLYLELKAKFQARGRALPEPEGSEQ